MHHPLLLAGLSLINMRTYRIYSHRLTLILTGDLPPLSMVPAQVPLVWLRFMKKTWQADVNSLGTFSLAGLFLRGGHNSHYQKFIFLKCTIQWFFYILKVVQLSPLSNSRTFALCLGFQNLNLYRCHFIKC